MQHNATVRSMHTPAPNLGTAKKTVGGVFVRQSANSTNTMPDHAILWATTGQPWQAPVQKPAAPFLRTSISGLQQASRSVNRRENEKDWRRVATVRMNSQKKLYYILYIKYYILYIVYRILYIIYYILYIVYYLLYIIMFLYIIIYYILYYLLYIIYIIFYVLYIMYYIIFIYYYIILYYIMLYYIILYYIYFILNIIYYMLYFIYYIFYIIYYILYI